MKDYKMVIDKKKRQVPKIKGFEEELNFKLQLFEDQMELLKEYEHKGLFKGTKLG